MKKKKVKYIVIDLWKSYKDLTQRYFPNAKIVADKFHYVRYATEMVDTIRKEVKNKLGKEEKKYFKYSRKLPFSRYENLKDEKPKEELNDILINYSEKLRIAYSEKERLLDIIHMRDAEKAIKLLNEWGVRCVCLIFQN